MNEEILAMLSEIRPEFDFTDSDDFVMDGLLDSFDIISLSSMLEEKYGVIIDGLDIVPENYSSVEAIAALVIKSGGKTE
ncbi:MAG: acyl carrier protein [Lachnospiraceae bacterium]|jgi:acyl carrier protein|nr:acyl carrier protein [uncultured Acetatifactor sp.]MCI8288038.1 acyl carrier protein [Lachnospiraceae bacterium]